MSEHTASRVTRPLTARAPVQPVARNAAGWTATPSADRSFKVLQPSRSPAQLSLFPPPGLQPRR